VADEAFEAALRILRHRDRSVAEVERSLAERGFSVEDRDDAVERLVRTGLVDDERFARARASSLSGRGAGDARVRQELRDAGIDASVVEEAIAELEPESLRAHRIAARRGGGPRTARYLRANGFAAEVVGDVVASDLEDALP
jgi:SOS response regulatory protein OraA/RecX